MIMLSIWLFFPLLEWMAIINLARFLHPYSFAGSKHSNEESHDRDRRQPGHRRRVATLAAARGAVRELQVARDRAQAVVDAIRGQGGTAVAVGADVSTEAGILALFNATDRELGPVAALVNNAGILETQMRVEQMDAARLQRIMQANVVGLSSCREAVRRMSTRHGGAGGVIVNVSSAPRAWALRRIRGLWRPRARSTP